MILQALLLVTKQAEPIKGLLTAIHSFVYCCPFLHSPVPLGQRQAGAEQGGHVGYV